MLGEDGKICWKTEFGYAEGGGSECSDPKDFSSMNSFEALDDGSSERESEKAVAEMA